MDIQRIFSYFKNLKIFNSPLKLALEGRRQALDKFAELHPRVLSSCDIIEEVLYAGDLNEHERLGALSFLGQVAHIENIGRLHYGTHEIEFDPLYLNIRDLVHFINRLPRKAIPANEWEVLVAEGVDLIRKLHREGRLEHFEEDERFKEYKKRYMEKHEHLRLKKHYSDLDEIMDD